MHMTTAERVSTYYPFDGDILEIVSETADRQNKLGYTALAGEYGITYKSEPIENEYGRQLLSYLRITPKEDYDERKVRVYHAPMGIPADENMAMRAIRLFGADSSEQLMVIGNPAAIGRKENLLPRKALLKVWRGDLKPAVAPLLQYLNSENISEVVDLGYSYGADKAVTSSEAAASYDIESTQGVYIEPAAVISRSLARLLADFKSTEPELARYIAQTASPALEEARALADTGFTRYVGGLLRMGNIAIAHALTKPFFETRLRRALEAQPNLRTVVAWGSESELTPTQPVEDSTLITRLMYGRDSVKPMELKGMHHAGGDDIDLHAAIILQGLKDTKAR